MKVLTVHVLGKPVLPAALDVLLPSLRTSGGFSADQLAQPLDPADVLDGRVAASVPNDGGQVDRGAALGGRSLEDRAVHGEDVPQQPGVHLLVPGLGPEIRGDVRDQGGGETAGQGNADSRQNQHVPVW